MTLDKICRETECVPDRDIVLGCHPFDNSTYFTFISVKPDADEVLVIYKKNEDTGSYERFYENTLEAAQKETTKNRDYFDKDADDFFYNLVRCIISDVNAEAEAKQAIADRRARQVSFFVSKCNGYT